MKKLTIAVFLVLLSVTCTKKTTNVTSHTANPRFLIEWDANTEPDLKGYKVYQGFASRKYAFAVFVTDTNYVFEHAIYDCTYYFAITALDSANNESGFSDEVFGWVVSFTPDTTVIDSIPPSQPGGVVCTPLD